MDDARSIGPDRERRVPSAARHDLVIALRAARAALTCLDFDHAGRADPASNGAHQTVPDPDKLRELTLEHLASVKQMQSSPSSLEPGRVAALAEFIDVQVQRLTALDDQRQADLAGQRELALYMAAHARLHTVIGAQNAAHAWGKKAVELLDQVVCKSTAEYGLHPQLVMDFSEVSSAQALSYGQQQDFQQAAMALQASINYLSQAWKQICTQE